MKWPKKRNDLTDLVTKIPLIFQGLLAQAGKFAVNTDESEREHDRERA